MNCFGRSIAIVDTATDDLQINESVKGMVKIKDDTLTIEPDVRDEADVHATSVMVPGSMHGSIVRIDRIKLAAKPKQRLFRAGTYEDKMSI